MKVYQISETKFLTSKLSSNETNRFIRAKIYDSSFGSFVTEELAHLSEGLYTKEVTLSLGKYYVYYEVFEDAAFTLKDTNYSDSEEIISVTSNNETMMLEIYRLQGLDPDSPMTVTGTGRTVSGITQVFSGDGIASTTVTRV